MAPDCRWYPGAGGEVRWASKESKSDNVMLHAELEALSGKGLVIQEFLMDKELTDRAEAIQFAVDLARPEDLVIVLGWSNGLYEFDADDLSTLPPVFICNDSLHTYLMNDDAARRLRGNYPEIVANIHDQDWIERHPRVDPTPVGGEVPSEVLEQLEALGYLN